MLPCQCDYFIVADRPTRLHHRTDACAYQFGETIRERKESVGRSYCAFATFITCTRNG
jgi:hypothetical protein